MPIYEVSCHIGANGKKEARITQLGADRPFSREFQVLDPCPECGSLYRFGIPEGDHSCRCGHIFAHKRQRQ